MCLQIDVGLRDPSDGDVEDDEGRIQGLSGYLRAGSGSIFWARGWGQEGQGRSMGNGEWSEGEVVGITFDAGIDTSKERVYSP